MISLARYTALLELREFRQIILVSLLGRLPIGICGLAILLLVRLATGSFAAGGAASGCYIAGLAVIAPVLGRLIDRYGPRATLVASAIAFPAALSALVATVSVGGATWLTWVCAASAGASFPPITVCMRTYFKRRLADDASLAAAYSLESVLIETIFIVGPVLVALFVAFASPALAVFFAAGCGCIGTVLFLRSPAVKAWHIDNASRRGLLGPLAGPGFISLICVILCYSTAFGLMEIGVTGYAIQIGEPALAGVLLGLMSVSSALGGLAYGSRSWNHSLSKQFAITLGFMAAGLAVLALRWQPWMFGVWCIAAGTVMAPALIIQSMLIAKAARAEHSTEAFTWSTSALLSGIGLGLATGGGLLEMFDARAPFAAAAATAFGAAAGARFLLRERQVRA